MLLKLFNNKFFLVFFIFILSVSINQYFGFIGINPLDNFTIYNSGYLILNNQIPFNDFWVITGPLLDYLQSIFFKIFGLNWSSYVFHASLVNFLFSLIIFLCLEKFGLSQKLCLLYSSLTALIFYPTVATPFVDHHAVFFSITALLVFLLGINFKNNLFWFLLPIILILGFFSKQTPTSYFAILIGFMLLYNLIIFREFNSLIYAVFSSIITLIVVFISFNQLDINFQFFYDQYIKFASSVGQERITSGGFLKPINFSRYIVKFKLIHISYISLLLIIIWKTIKLKNYFLTKEFITLSSLILSSYILIAHQLLTLNSKFIFCIIPLLCGFSNIYLLKFFKKKDIKLNYLIIAFSICVTIYNFEKYVYDRKFLVINSYFDRDKIYTTKIIDNKSNFKWISHYNSEPENEIRDINTTVNKIISLQKNSNEKYIIITDYQFIFSSFELNNAVTINKLYGHDVSYPSIQNPNFEIYQQYFLEKVVRNQVKKIYIIKPTWFKEHKYALNSIFKSNCKKVSENKNLVTVDIKNCLD